MSKDYLLSCIGGTIYVIVFACLLSAFLCILYDEIRDMLGKGKDDGKRTDNG